MHLDDHIKNLLDLGKILKDVNDPKLSGIIQQAHIHNNWFEPSEIKKCFQAWALNLTEENLIEWSSRYTFKYESSKSIGLVLAGNIPLVGMHDLICVILSGHKALVKLSSKDSILMKYIIMSLRQIDERYKDRIEMVERLNAADAFIATGSDNSSRYFEKYFAKKPNIIRKNRNSIAVLDGSETKEQLKALGEDIFTYFGLGCRNVTKVYLPKDFELERMFVAFEDYYYVMNNNKYKNNYDYNCTLLLMNKVPFLSNNFIMLREDEALYAPTGTVHYERYEDEADLKSKLDQLDEDKIQCKLGAGSDISFGQAQQPKLWDYADNVDTLEFLLGL